MTVKPVDSDYAKWFSTYGSLTAARVLEHFGIKFQHEALVAALKNDDGIYAKILRVPMMNILNGIIFQQGYDYQVYAQKLFIDYRLSPEYAKEPDMPGANTRENLNEQYNQLSELSNTFNEQQLTHYRLISDSQMWLIQAISQLQNPSEDLVFLEKDPLFEEKLTQFLGLAMDVLSSFRSYRTQFYNMILRITESLMHLSDYQFDVDRTAKERELLFFDDKIGDAQK